MGLPGLQTRRYACMATSAALVVVQVPAHTLRHVDDVSGERLQIEVSLPGVSAAAELIVLIRERSVSVRAPGRYNLVRPPVPPLPSLSSKGRA